MKILHEDLRQIPPSYAVLDATGTIVDVSPAWRDFGRSEGLSLAEDGVGRNYLDYCAAPGSAAVARRIRDLLEQRTYRIAFLYPCHSPTRQRWFVMIGLPSRSTGGKGRATLFHVEVTGLLDGEVDPMSHTALLGLDRTLALSDEDEIVELLAAALSN
jgi:hypothetical protein